MDINFGPMWPVPLFPLPQEAVSGHASIVGVMQNVTLDSEYQGFSTSRGGSILATEMNVPCIPVPFWLGVPQFSNIKEQRPYLPGDMNLDKGAIFPNMGGQRNLYQILVKKSKG